MNYYIQGDAANADKIRAAFEKLGYEKSNTRDYSNEHWFFFTYKGKVICTDDEVYIDLVKGNPDYKELELSVEHKFKVGDWIAYNENKSSITPMQIISITESKYIVSGHWSYDFRTLEADWHLWSITDAKDGDVIATDNGWTCIFKAFDGYVFSSYCFIDSQKWFCKVGSEAHTLDSRINGNIHPATKEQRDILFKRMKESGYKWDADKKELKKIQPHYDIANFKAGMPVLVRDNIRNKWLYTLFGMYNKDNVAYPFVVVDMRGYAQCIPFNEDTKHLLGTTDMPSEEFINW